LASIYIRQKNAEGKWRYQRVQTGPGRKTAHVTGPFFFRPTVNGKQKWHELGATTVKEAEQEVNLNAVAIDAAWLRHRPPDLTCLGIDIPIGLFRS
jgi:hypothetical protein